MDLICVSDGCVISPLEANSNRGMEAGIVEEKSVDRVSIEQSQSDPQQDIFSAPLIMAAQGGAAKETIDASAAGAKAKAKMTRKTAILETDLSITILYHIFCARSGLCGSPGGGQGRHKHWPWLD